VRYSVKSGLAAVLQGVSCEGVSCEGASCERERTERDRDLFAALRLT
jgi:hypothetical protein